MKVDEVKKVCQNCISMWSRVVSAYAKKVSFYVYMYIEVAIPWFCLESPILTVNKQEHTIPDFWFESTARLEPGPHINTEIITLYIDMIKLSKVNM